jgi:hypothetical protein
MAKKPPSKEQTLKQGNTSKKTKVTSKPVATTSKTPTKPEFTKKVDDLDLED